MPSTSPRIFRPARPSRWRRFLKEPRSRSRSSPISRAKGTQRKFMKTKKSWRDKLADSKGLPKVSEVTGKLSKRWGEGTMVIPAPLEVDALMKRVPKGKLVTINELRAALAAKHKVSFACPLTTGIFSWIAAHAANEAEVAGASRITPYWRTLKTGGELNPKYPGGV